MIWIYTSFAILAVSTGCCLLCFVLSERNSLKNLYNETLDELRRRQKDNELRVGRIRTEALQYITSLDRGAPVVLFQIQQILYQFDTYIQTVEDLIKRSEYAKADALVKFIHSQPQFGSDPDGSIGENYWIEREKQLLEALTALEHAVENSRRHRRALEQI